MNGEFVLSVCGILALVIALVTVALVAINLRDLKRVVRILGVCVFLMLMTGIYPCYHGESYAIGLTLVESMCAMLLNSNPSEILSAFDYFNVSYIGIYKSVLLVLLIVAPLFTVGITLSFFSDKFTRMLYKIRSKFKDTYLFSAINERTLCIAEDIYESHGKAVIVFALRIGKDDIDAEALSRIKLMGAYVINDDVAHISHSLKHTRNYYLLDTDSGENLDTGLRLYYKYNSEQTDKVNMWLYTKNEISEVIFDYLYETFNVRLINEEVLIARDLVTEHPLYDAVCEDRLSVLLVGGGNIGLEILRNVTMCSCLGENISLDINVIDLNGEKAKGVFEKTSPGLAEVWNIKFHSADIKTAAFTHILRSISPTYVIISLGNEGLNMETAMYIRRLYGISNGKPLIHTLIDHKSINEHIVPGLCVSDWSFNADIGRFKSTPVCSFDLRTFGSYEDTYKGLRIRASYRDCLAVAVNAVKCGITELDEKYTPEVLSDLYNQVFFYKDYSDAFAVSIPYKLYLLGLELSDDGRGDVSCLEESIVSGAYDLKKHENKRYEAFMRGKGWTDMTPDEVINGKMSDKLMKKNARLNTRNDTILEEITGRSFKDEDVRTIMNLPAIISLANELYGKGYSIKTRS